MRRLVTMIGLALIAVGANLHSQTLGFYVITGISVTDLSPWYSSESVANDVNDGGTVVGWAGTATLKSAFTHQFGMAWDSGATFPGESSEIIGINNLDERVGYRTVDGVPRPVFWDDSGWLDLDGGNDSYGFARAINDYRTITGTNSYGTGFWLTPWSPYRWIRIQHHGFDINNAGIIVGQNRGAGPTRIFRWESGVFAYLVPPPHSPPQSFPWFLDDPSNPSDRNPYIGGSVRHQQSQPDSRAPCRSRVSLERDSHEHEESGHAAVWLDEQGLRHQRRGFRRRRRGCRHGTADAWHLLAGA